MLNFVNLAKSVMAAASLINGAAKDNQLSNLDQQSLPAVIRTLDHEAAPVDLSRASFISTTVQDPVQDFFMFGPAGLGQGLLNRNLQNFTPRYNYHPSVQQPFFNNGLLGQNNFQNYIPRYDYHPDAQQFQRYFNGYPQPMYNYSQQIPPCGNYNTGQYYYAPQQAQPHQFNQQALPPSVDYRNGQVSPHQPLGPDGLPPRVDFRNGQVTPHQPLGPDGLPPRVDYLNGQFSPHVENGQNK